MKRLLLSLVIAIGLLSSQLAFASTSVTWNGTSYDIPAAGETGWENLSNFLIALGNNAGVTNVLKQAVRVATTTPVTVSDTTDCVVATKLAVAGAVAVTLPAGTNGRWFAIVDQTGDAATNNITITPNGAQTINGAATYVISDNNGGVILVYSTTNTRWNVVGRYIAGSVVTNSSTTTFTNKTFDADGSGNSITNIENADIKAAAAIAGSKITPAFTAATSVTGAADVAQLTVKGHTTQTDTTSPLLLLDIAASAPEFVSRRSQGTLGSPTVVVDTSVLGRWIVRGYDGAAFQSAGMLEWRVDGTPGSSDMPGKLSVFVTPDGSATPGEIATFRNTGVTIKGTTTNDSAATGFVGEFSENLRSSALSVETSTAGQFTGSVDSGATFGTNTTTGETGITLTAGDWDITGNIRVECTTDVLGSMGAWVGTATGTSTTGRDSNRNYTQIGATFTASQDYSLVLPTYRVSIAATTTYYLKGLINFTHTSGTVQLFGSLRARRIR